MISWQAVTVLAELTVERELRNVAFCCISTGEYHFPGEKAAEIAVKTVKNFLAKNNTIERVIFDVFTDQDRQYYQNEMKRSLKSV